MRVGSEDVTVVLAPPATSLITVITLAAGLAALKPSTALIPNAAPVPIAILSATPLLVPSPREKNNAPDGGSSAVAVSVVETPSCVVKVIVVPAAILDASVTVIVQLAGVSNSLLTDVQTLSVC